MSPSQIIVLATPAFLALIAIEWFVGRARQRNTYRLDDALTSIGLGILSQVSAVFTQLLRIGIYTAVFSMVSLVPDTGFWTHPMGWLLALVFYDFCYYWHHRLGHTCALFWAAHVVHHQSEDYNLSTALRQTSSGALAGWLFYLPMALAGVPPLVFAVVGLVDLLYQYWIHTQQIGKLGWFDRVFASPSNHRVHHAVNDRYLDRNYGGILILWDRLFGSFHEEDDDQPCVYGTRSPLRSWDPIWANAEVYASLWQSSWRTRRWRDKLRVWLMPPGWLPPDLAQKTPKQPFDFQKVQRYAPPLTPGMVRFALMQFALLLAGAGVYLWFTDGWPLWQSGVWFGVLLAGVWALGAVMQGRLTMGEALMIECATLSMATAATGLLEWHRVFKPLTMVIALVIVFRHGAAAGNNRIDTRRMPRGHAWLLAALAASLAGDIWLMLGGFFVPGLVGFLLAHIAYTVLFSQGVSWRTARGASAVLMVVSVAIYAILWSGGLPVALRLPVALYVLAIVIMASRAIGRAQVLGDGHSRWVALGALCFLLSDSLLAINKFVTPLPHSPVWVLSSYYTAQCLIVMGWLRSRSTGNPAAA